MTIGSSGFWRRCATTILGFAAAALILAVGMLVLPLLRVVARMP
jgi:hypothetical protein